MFRIEHGDAIELESIVRRLFNCDRSGVSGLADADNFESHPMDAAIMVVSTFMQKVCRAVKHNTMNSFANTIPFSHIQMKMMRKMKCKII